MKVSFTYVPHKAQQPVHQACEQTGPEAPFFIFVAAGRQSGKSLSSLIQMSKWLLENKGTRGVWISPTESQAVKAYREMGNALSKQGLVKSKRSSSGALELVLVNKSIIQFKSASAGDGLRGNTYEWFCIDEAAFIKEETWSEVIIPMATTKGRKVLVTSTPRGANNWFAQWFNKSSDPKSKVRSFRYTSLDNPHSNKELIELFKNSLSPNQYQQEMEARFIDGANPFDGASLCFSSDLQPLTGPQPGRRYYAGVDVAMSSDFTVCVMMDDLGQVCYIDRFNNIPAPAIRERLVKTFRLFGVKTALIESNNQGAFLISEMKSQGIRNIQEFLTTNQSKSDLIDGLISAFANKQISIPGCTTGNFRILRDELDAFSLSYTKTGKAKYEASYGNDDVVMALNFALRCKNQYAYISQKPTFYIG